MMKSNQYMRKYYTDKGYDVGKRGSSFEIKVSDLSVNSNASVLVICDFCQKEFYMEYNKYLGSIENGNCCSGCRYEKIKYTNMKKYGVENTSQLEEVKNKRIFTNMDRYGVPSNLNLKETHEKIRITNQEKYGADYFFLTPEGKEMSKKTCMEKYGVDNPSKNLEVKEKQRRSLYENGTCPTSKAQKYIHKLIGGELNYPFEYYNVDIFLENLNIYIEYDGSGHNLNVKKGEITQEAFDKRNLIRYYYLKSKGLKMIQIINVKDKLPNDNTITNDILNAIEFLKTSKDSHFLIDWDRLL